MKSFKDYLTESKQVYEFKVKIAGDCPKECAAQIKSALDAFKVENCSAGKSTPIQELQRDFPEHKNISMTVFDVTTAYPATSAQITDAIAAKAGIEMSKICVRNSREQEEYDINHAHDELTGEALVGTDYAKENNQDIVGEKRAMSFLKTLNKDTRTTGTPITGVNDALLAKTAPKEKAATSTDKIGTASTIGSKATKLPALKIGK